FLNYSSRLLRPLGEAFRHPVTHALDFKTMLRWRDLITDLFNPLRQFVPINRRAVTNRVIHFARLQGFPTAFGFIKRGIEHREMGMQLRVERATARVREGGGDQIAGGSVALVAVL